MTERILVSNAAAWSEHAGSNGPTPCRPRARRRHSRFESGLHCSPKHDRRSGEDRPVVAPILERITTSGANRCGSSAALSSPERLYTQNGPVSGESPGPSVDLIESEQENWMRD